MFELNNERTGFPVKIWLDDISSIEDNCLEQAYNLSKIPFIHKWVALMPDTHVGKGMPIGGVIACKNHIIPKAVGNDIGCGMNFVATNIQVSEIKDIQTGNGNIFQSIISSIMREVPVGRALRKTKIQCKTLESKLDNSFYEEELLESVDRAYYQIGTLGGGNHFIELQEDENGYLCIMLHSGSRSFGADICQYFNDKAREYVSGTDLEFLDEYMLSCLPVDSEYGQRYIKWMNLALNYAYENREIMMDISMKSLKEKIEKFTDLKVEFSNYINCHHNYAALETHYGEDVWVHRKGAIRACKDEIAIVPGAMGSYSYIVKGLGNPESFNSSSHGAGRKYSRNDAIEKFTTENVILDLREKNIVLGKKNKNDVAEECRFAYKDIEDVMKQEKDLVEPIRKLHTVAVIKG